jgi:hypothetical protein
MRHAIDENLLSAWELSAHRAGLFGSRQRGTRARPYRAMRARAKAYMGPRRARPGRPGEHRKAVQWGHWRGTERPHLPPTVKSGLMPVTGMLAGHR